MLEKWNSKTSAGDLIYRDQLLGEIKTNMINVISDYKGLGVENELDLIARANTLFTGDIIPSRRDWNTLGSILNELSTVKEQGQMYNYFLRDVRDDSLGISDLEKIKDFIDYIQTLPPVDAPVSIVLNPPVMYGVTEPKDSTTDEWDHATVKWGLTSNYLEKPTAKVVVSKSISEDVKKYIIKITAGSYTSTKEYTPTQLQDTTLTLDWLNWFSASQLTNAYVKVDVSIVDKRENTTTYSQTVYYPSGVHIPRGVRSYQLEYQRDNDNWKRLTSTSSSQSHYWDVPRVNGTYQYSVRALDWNGQYTRWTNSAKRYIKFIPDKPPKPVPVVNSTSLNSVTITWKAVARAERYEVWVGGLWREHDASKGKIYSVEVSSTATRSVKFYPLSANKSYTFYVRAINEGGSNDGSVVGTTKKKVVTTKSYVPTGYRVWTGSYSQRSRWDHYTSYPADWTALWRSNNTLYQSGWREPHKSNTPKYPGWDSRGGGGSTYWAWGHQGWGNNMSFIFLPYSTMRKELKGKTIESVSITLKRANSVHGYPKGKPLYLYNHNERNNKTAPGSWPFFREDYTRVNHGTQRAIKNVTMSRSGTETITNARSKKLIQNIVDGWYEGIGMIKYHGSTFNANLTIADQAYMQFEKDVKIEVKYSEII